MPIFIADTQKREARKALSFICGDWWPESLTTIGNAGGTTAIFSSLIGLAAASIIGKYLLLTSGTYTGQWRVISNFDNVTGTITVARAFGGQVASGVTVEIHEHRPDLYTLAINDAILVTYTTGVRRPVEVPIIIPDRSGIIGLPINLRTINSIFMGGPRKIKDLFDRADSTTSAGSDWTATTGTWGISSERLYSVSDADAGLLTRDPNLKDGYIQAIVRGTLNSGATYRSPPLCFRIAEDYLGAIDTNNYLLVRLLNGVVDLRKVDAGTESSLTTSTQTTSDGVDYVLGVHFAGDRIRVYLDRTVVIDYRLLGLNLKYLNNPRVGIRWDKAGSPATAARVDDYFAFDAYPEMPVQSYFHENDMLRLTINPAIGDLCFVRGHNTLSALAEDTTFGTLAADTTEAMEIELTDPAINILLNYAKYSLYKMLAQPGNTLDENEQQLYNAVAQGAMAEYDKLLKHGYVPSQRLQVRHL